MSLQIVDSVDGMTVKRNRGGRTSPDLDAIRALPEGKHALIEFDPATNVSFHVFMNRKRANLYKTSPTPTLPFKPKIAAGEKDGKQFVIVQRPLGSTYVTNEDGTYRTDAEGQLVTIGVTSAV